jgi:hypothetical protein
MPNVLRISDFDGSKIKNNENQNETLYVLD